MPGVAVVIPTFNEVAAIATVIGELPGFVRQVVVADSGSRDGTQAAARAAGAMVLEVAERGYGRACAAAAAAADPDCDIIVFMDGDGADRGDLLAALVEPIWRGTDDFVIAARTRALRAPHSMSMHQVVAGHVLGFAIGLVAGTRYKDMCAYRAIRRGCLEQLGMTEMTYGWNIEMQIKAARAGLHILELPMPYRCRIGGQSKVAGSLRGTLKASWRIVVTFVRVAVTRQPSAAGGALKLTGRRGNQ